MSPRNPVIGTEYYIKVWSPLRFTPDSMLHGVYRISAIRHHGDTQIEAALLVRHALVNIGLAQPEHTIVQIYDRLGGEIPHVDTTRHADYDKPVQFMRCLDGQHPILTDILRDPDGMYSPMR